MTGKNIIYHNPACGTSRNVLALIRSVAVPQAHATPNCPQRRSTATSPG
jgi:hypothetical protein